MDPIDEERLRRNLQKDPMKGEWMRTGRVPYPKHVWSPAGGWYGQPKNWRTNTAIAFTTMMGFLVVTFYISGQIEEREKMPDKNAFYPSRYWSKQIREYEAKERGKEQANKGA